MSPRRGYCAYHHGCSIFSLMLFVLVEFHCVNGADDIRCYSCSAAWTIKRCLELNDPLTCGFGEVCYTTVTRGGFQSVKYDKGCMEKYHCLDLQSLNDRKNCKIDPSVCVYCCGNSLCNSAFRLFQTSEWITLLFLGLLCLLLCGHFV
ncbi:uncharacterized protein LOC121386370 [Gigantopelta aegis]|uniref:uncharacterized protein LOC121386370 n=1 Tax=Gigantopelta aegis TaxID=1735272 RepID=UPI001B88C648|nr:uncharacterized protein LOC121386370 [Gigantopelta aegis]